MKNEIEIQIYEGRNGKCPYLVWESKLPRLARAKISARYARIRLGNFGDCKSIQGMRGLYELRIHFGPGYRIYFGKEGSEVVLLLVGGDKIAKKEISLNLMNFGKAILRRKKGEIMARVRSYQTTLVKRLKDPKEAAAYLNAALEDDDLRVFLVALRDVAEAHGGISYLAKETDLNRESLYRTLSKQGNPTLFNLFHMLDALGLELNLKPAV